MVVKTKYTTKSQSHEGSQSASTFVTPLCLRVLVAKKKSTNYFKTSTLCIFGALSSITMGLINGLPIF